MVEHIDDEAIEKLATSTALTTDLGFLLSETGEFGPAGIVPFLKARADAADFPISIKANDKYTIITIHHRMGMKWSNVFRTFYKTILADLGITVKFEVTCNTIALLLSKKA